MTKPGANPIKIGVILHMKKLDHLSALGKIVCNYEKVELAKRLNYLAPKSFIRLTPQFNPIELLQV